MIHLIYEDVVPGSSKRRKAKDTNTPHFSWRSDNEFVPQYHAYDSTNAGTNTPHFSWRSDNEFVPQYHAYDSTNAGFRLLSDLEDENNFLQYFQCYFTEELVQKIATETNRYFEFVTQNTNKSKYSRLNHWRGTNTEEIFLLFLGMTILIARNKKLKISECWSRDCLLQTPIFQKVMSRDRYLLLLRLLHFCNNEEQKPGDRLFKLETVISSLKTTFRGSFMPFENLCIDESLLLYKGRLSFKQCGSFMPFENLCIDESLLLYKGRLSFKQCIRSKRHRFDVKFFVLTDVETDYVLDFIIYTGAITDLDEVYKSLGISGAVVYTLTWTKFIKV
ncbi:Transposase IS4 [Popillia japonica]|uniref:Transposase IS4 n=1 Tax=Popillia japonica TaxID=7064 RepID=A0AAW1JBR3_POPJA